MMLRKAAVFGMRCALAGALVAAEVPAHAAPPDAQAVAARAAALLEADRHGVIAMVIDLEERTEAPNYHETSHSRSWIVAENGIAAATGYLASEQNGRSLSRDVLLRESARADAAIKKHENDPHTVLRTLYLHEYRFADAACAGCADGERAVRYETDRHDIAHNNGIIIVAATGHVVRTIAQPFVFPKKYVDGGEFTTRYGTVLDGKRLPVEAIGTFWHRPPTKGSENYEQTFGYKRFRSVEEAVAATKLPG